MKLKILTFYYKDCEINPEAKKDFYYPILCGKSLYKGNSKFLKNIQGDNVGTDNISKLNNRLFEATGIYWAGLNFDKIGNPEYIGTSHYRRFLKFDETKLNEDTIFVNKYDFKNLNVVQQLTLAELDQNLLTSYLNIYLVFNPEDRRILNTFLNQHYIYSNNMFIMHKSLFFKYFDFLNLNINICKMFLSNLKYLNFKQNLKLKTNHEGGMFGMILERMTAFFLFKLERLNYNIIPCEIIGEQNK